MSIRQLSDYLEAAKEAARRAAVVLDDWRQRFTVRERQTETAQAGRRQDGRVVLTIADLAQARVDVSADLRADDPWHESAQERAEIPFGHEVGLTAPPWIPKTADAWLASR